MAEVANAIAGKMLELLVVDIRNQTQLVIDFGSQFQEMRNQLNLIKDFLADTENLKKKREVLKGCLTDMRELLYEADDAVIDCIIREEYHKDGCCYRFSPPEFFFRYQMGKKLKDLNSRVERMKSNLRSYLNPQQQQQLEENTYELTTYTSQIFDPTEIVGLENDAKKLKGWIFSGTCLHQRVGIVGMGGLGKTTIAKKIFNEKEVAGCFEHRIWVSVSQDFSEERIMSSILGQLGQNASGSDLSQMSYKINQSLQDKSYLIVMDDCWDSNKVQCGRLCSGIPKLTCKRSCIIVTTRDEMVAAHMEVENSQVHRPELLKENESLPLFCKFTFRMGKEKCLDKDLDRVGRDIVAKCGGLPLAIKTIAGILAYQPRNYTVWKDFHDRFQELLTIEGQNGSVMASLQLSYDALPMHLKPLLLCFSIYPEDFLIRAEQLVHWWVGEGLIHGTTQTRTEVELAYEYLMELVRRCLVEVVERRGYDERVYYCKMHDLVRELTIKIAKDHQLFDGFQNDNQGSTSKSRWLGFTREMFTTSLKRHSKLRALLLMSSKQDQITLNMDHLGSHGSIRVLDLSHIKLDNNSMKNLFNWIVSLERLAYLNLTGATSLIEVPPSVNRLRNLHLLILAECSNLVKLPPSITFLKKLVVLDLGSCGLRYLPKGIETLSQLEELSGFRLASQQITQSSRLCELQKLVQLRVLRMYVSEESEISEAEYKVLKDLTKLKVLGINTGGSKVPKILHLLNQLDPPPSLQELYLRRYHHETLPQWVNPGKLCSLQYLCIENANLIRNINPSSQSEESSGSTWNCLQGLCLKFLPNLEEDWNIMQNVMPSLRYIEVSHCFQLRNFPRLVNEVGIWRKPEA